MSCALHTLISHGWKHKTVEEHCPRAGGLVYGGKDEVALTWLLARVRQEHGLLHGPYG